MPKSRVVKAVIGEWHHYIALNLHEVVFDPTPEDRDRIFRESAVELAQDRVACPKSQGYKGVRLTKCLPDGSQCEACKKIWDEKHG